MTLDLLAAFGDTDPQLAVWTAACESATLPLCIAREIMATKCCVLTLAVHDRVLDDLVTFPLQVFTSAPVCLGAISVKNDKLAKMLRQEGQDQMRRWQRWG